MDKIALDVNNDLNITPRKVLMQAIGQVDEIDKLVIMILHKDGTRRRYVCTGSEFMTNALLIDALQPGWDRP